MAEAYRQVRKMENLWKLDLKAKKKIREEFEDQVKSLQDELKDNQDFLKSEQCIKDQFENMLARCQYVYDNAFEEICNFKDQDHQ